MICKRDHRTYCGSRNVMPSDLTLRCKLGGSVIVGVANDGTAGGTSLNDSSNDVSTMYAASGLSLPVLDDISPKNDIIDAVLQANDDESVGLSINGTNNGMNINEENALQVNEDRSSGSSLNGTSSGVNITNDMLQSNCPEADGSTLNDTTTTGINTSIGNNKVSQSNKGGSGGLISNGTSSNVNINDDVMTHSNIG